MVHITINKPIFYNLASKLMPALMQSIISCINLYITMPRITVDISDATLAQIDAEAKLQKVSRSKWAAEAIDAYMQQKDITSDAEVHQLEARVMQLQQELVATNSEIDTYRTDADMMQKVPHLEAQVMQLQKELDRKTNDLDAQNADLLVKEEELKKLKNDNELKWRETSQLRSEISQTKRELESTRSKVDQLQTELDNRRSEVENARNDTEKLRHDQDHYKDTLAMKDKQIGFLEGHVAQLTQSISQFALKPGDEEIKRKGWWQFWK
jgi:chromosome segregation ATPase